MLRLAALSGLFAAAGVEQLPPGAQYGILGIGLAILASGRVVVPIGWLRDEREARLRETARADAERARTDAMQQAAQNEMVPALQASAAAVERSTVIITRLYDEKIGH